jgi:hypothetical protein
VRLPVSIPSAARRVFAAATLRSLTLKTMNVELRIPRREG